MRGPAVGAAVLVLASFAGDAKAQWLPRVAVGASAAMAQWDRSADPGARTGMLLGAHGRLGWRNAALEVAYAQGTLSPEDDASASEDLVDGEAMLAVTAMPWLTLSVGTHLRALVTPSGTERWVRHEARARVETDLVPGAMTADAEAALALVSDVNSAADGLSARGATVGVNLRVQDSSLRLRLAYSVDRATNGGATELLQAISLHATLGLSRPGSPPTASRASRAAPAAGRPTPR